MKTKKINPRRIPATWADVEKARKQSLEDATEIAWAIMFTCLRDKFGFGPVRLHRLWGYVNEISEEIADGRINIKDLTTVLKEEASIILVDQKDVEDGKFRDYEVRGQGSPRAGNLWRS